MVKTFHITELLYLVTGLQLTDGMSVDEMVSFISLNPPPATRITRRQAVHIVMAQHPVLRRIVPQCCTASFLEEIMTEREMRFRNIENGTASCMNHVKTSDWDGILAYMIDLVGEYFDIMDIELWLQNEEPGDRDFQDYKKGDFMVQDICNPE